MSYKTMLQELENKRKEIEDEKRETQKKFFEIAAKQIQDDFPFPLIKEDSYGKLNFLFSMNGKFRCSKTLRQDFLFLGNFTIQFYYEKDQNEKFEKAKKIIKELFEKDLSEE